MRHIYAFTIGWFLISIIFGLIVFLDLFLTVKMLMIGMVFISFLSFCGLAYILGTAVYETIGDYLKR